MRASSSSARLGIRLAWCAIGLLLAFSFAVDYDHVSQGGAIDLRNRVTGARLLLDHLDPYFYKWQEAQPPEYCDPYNNPQLPVSKTTATPALLALEIPVAVLPYRTAQFAWLGLQWLFLLGTGWIWLRSLETAPRRLLLAAFLTGFTYTAAWRLHAERGQSYVLLLFLSALWLAGSLRIQPRREFALGLLAGFLCALRPPGLLLAPFLLLHRRSQVPGAILGLLLGLILPLFWRGDVWLKYASAMQTHSLLYRSAIDPAPGPERFPPAIEGIPTDLLANYVALPYADFSLHNFFRGLGLEPLPAWPFLLLLLIAFALWLWFSRKLPWPRLLLGLAIWLFLADLFLPAYRNIYNDVLGVNIVALALFAAPRFSAGLSLCFLAVPLGWIICLTAPMHDWLIDLPSFVFTLGALLLLFWFNFPARSRKV